METVSQQELLQQHSHPRREKPSPARSVPAHAKAAALLPQQQKIFESYQNARLNSQGTSILANGHGQMMAPSPAQQNSYQGFEQRSQETYYFKMLEQTFKVLIEQLVKCVTPQLSSQPQQRSSTTAEIDSKASFKLRKCFKALRLMESHKGQAPYFSHCLRALHPFLIGSATSEKITIDSGDDIDAVSLERKQAYMQGAPPSGICGNGSANKNLNTEGSFSASDILNQDDAEPSPTKFRDFSDKKVISQLESQDLNPQTELSSLIVDGLNTPEVVEGGQKLQISNSHQMPEIVKSNHKRDSTGINVKKGDRRSDLGLYGYSDANKGAKNKTIQGQASQKPPIVKNTNLKPLKDKLYDRSIQSGGAGMLEINDSCLAIRDNTTESIYSREQPSNLVHSEDIKPYQSRNSHITSTVKDRQNRIHSGGDNYVSTGGITGYPPRPKAFIPIQIKDQSQEDCTINTTSMSDIQAGVPPQKNSKARRQLLAELNQHSDRLLLAQQKTSKDSINYGGAMDLNSVESNNHHGFKVSKTFYDKKKLASGGHSGNNSTLRLPQTTSNCGARPHIRQIRQEDFFQGSNARGGADNLQSLGQDTSRKNTKTSKSKKRKYASQPRAGGRLKKLPRDTLPPMMELPLSKIKESVPQYYNRSDYNNGPTIKDFTGGMTKKQNSSRRSMQRSLSASSNSSRRSFRATRKRPSFDNGPSDQLVSKFKPTGAKFVRPNKRRNNKGSTTNINNLSQDLNPVIQDGALQQDNFKYLKNLHMINQTQPISQDLSYIGEIHDGGDRSSANNSSMMHIQSNGNNSQLTLGDGGVGGDFDDTQESLMLNDTDMTLRPVKASVLPKTGISAQSYQLSRPHHVVNYKI